MAPRGPLTPGPGWVPQGSSPVVDYGPAGDRSRALPVRRPRRRRLPRGGVDEGEPLYVSEDLRVRRADTGPLAVGGRDDATSYAEGDDATPYGPEEQVDDELLWESFEEWGAEGRRRRGADD